MSGLGQAAGHEGGHGPQGHGLVAGWRALVVAGGAAVLAGPGEGARGGPGALDAPDNPAALSNNAATH